MYCTIVAKKKGCCAGVMMLNELKCDEKIKLMRSQGDECRGDLA